jgi:hypothetical protein
MVRLLLAIQNVFQRLHVPQIDVHECIRGEVELLLIAGPPLAKSNIYLKRRS